MSVQLVSKIFNLCGPDPPTSHTDGQTDDMRSQDRALDYIVHRAVKTAGVVSYRLPGASPSLLVLVLLADNKSVIALHVEYIF